MDVNLKACPNSSSHQVYGGYPEYVCTECATEWITTYFKGQMTVRYTHFDENGKVLKRWRVPLEQGITKRRRLSA